LSPKGDFAFAMKRALELSKKYFELRGAPFPCILCRYLDTPKRDMGYTYGDLCKGSLVFFLDKSVKKNIEFL
jgi:hypothetical protein